MLKPLSDEFLKKEVTITPMMLGDAIARATKRETCDAPEVIRDRMAKIFMKFGAVVMTELLCNDLGLEPEEDINYTEPNLAEDTNKEDNKNVN